MKSRIRIKGGVKNNKTGKRWKREELIEVLKLYMSDRQLKIHETNIKVQNLGLQLERTTRSVEAQLLMFRNLDRNGFYGYKNMNKLCRDVWKEYINQNLT